MMAKKKYDKNGCEGLRGDKYLTPDGKESFQLCDTPGTHCDFSKCEILRRADGSKPVPTMQHDPDECVRRQEVPGADGRMIRAKDAVFHQNKIGLFFIVESFIVESVGIGDAGGVRLRFKGDLPNGRHVWWPHLCTFVEPAPNAAPTENHDAPIRLHPFPCATEIATALETAIVSGLAALATPTRRQRYKKLHDATMNVARKFDIDAVTDVFHGAFMVRMRREGWELAWACKLDDDVALAADELETRVRNAARDAGEKAWRR